MKKHFYGGVAWIFENPARPLLLAVIALLLVIGGFQRSKFTSAVARAQTMACPAPAVLAAPAPMIVPVADPGPTPRPKWTEPTRQPAMLDPRDGCARLAGLGHAIGKCWSNDLYDHPAGVSKWLYHADWSMICATKRKAGLLCQK